MAIDLTKLAGQGRAYSPARAWTPEELDALVRLETERGIGRLKAADFIRNGILTLEAYDAALKATFKPKTLEDAQAVAESALKDNEFVAGVDSKESTETKPKKGKE